MPRAARPRRQEAARRGRRVGTPERASAAGRGGARQLRVAVRRARPRRARRRRRRPLDRGRGGDDPGALVPAGRPAGDDARPLVVYFHGGGWLLGSVDSHDAICRSLANASGAVVLNVGYRLAPEARFPAAADDALAATRWAHANAALPGRRPAPPRRRRRLGRAATSQRSSARTCATPASRIVRFQLLVYPVTTADLTNGFDMAYEGYFLYRDEMLLAPGALPLVAGRRTQPARLAAARRPVGPAAGLHPGGRVRPAPPAGRALPGSARRAPASPVDFRSYDGHDPRLLRPRQHLRRRRRGDGRRGLSAARRASPDSTSWPRIWPRLMPPSTTSVVPVMKREAGEARKPTTSAMSSGSPQRPSGVCDRIQRVALVGLRRGGHRRADQAGRDRVDADAPRAELDRERLGQRAQRRLRRGVDRRGRTRHREHRDGLDRGDADHRAAGRHAVDETLEQEERRARVDADHALPVGEPDLAERPRLDHARAVDEHVDARAERRGSAATRSHRRRAGRP